MNNQIKRASWEENIKEGRPNNDNTIMLVGLSVLVAVCFGIYVAVVIIKEVMPLI